MSSGKRLAKRSILGTRVMAPGVDGLYEPGMIQAMKTYEDPSLSNRYSVRFDESRRVVEFLEMDIIGPGFQSVNSVHLQPGQVVFITHNQREMQARVIRHDTETQDVLLRMNEDDTLLRKIDEVRLLESRKSARLVNSDTDFSKLADVNISASASSSMSSDKSNSKKSKAIEVPRSDYVQIAGSRKRRTSENIPDETSVRDYCTYSDEEEVMTECSAALLLMKLSCSPHSPAFYGSSAPPGSSGLLRHQKMLPSPVESSSGASSFRSSTPSPPLSSSVTDEGIVKDYSSDQSGLQQTRLIFQCTYPGCREEKTDVASIEAHVRMCHLNREADDQFDDGEEEFYYTEVEVAPAPPPRVRSYSHSVVFDLSLADHLDMARPPHEDPGLATRTIAIPSRPAAKVRSFSGGNRFNNSSLLTTSQQQQQPQQHPLTMPITIAPSAGSPGKFILISPPSNQHHTSIKSPTRRIREGKKCRKVYGLEQRDLWCTQCKWKKACARFGSHAHPAVERNNNVQQQMGGGALSLPSGQSSSLLMTANQQIRTSFDSSAIKAIKF